MLYGLNFYVLGSIMAPM